VAVDLAEFSENEDQQDRDHEDQDLKSHKAHMKTALEIGSIRAIPVFQAVLCFKNNT